MLMQKATRGANYLPLVEYVVESIRQGKFAPRDRIPSENDLIRQFSISRHEVRQALGHLEKMGWITTVQGKGSYVRPRPPQVSYLVSGSTSFTDNMVQAGKKYKSVLLEWKRSLPTEEEAQNLQLNAGPGEVYRLEILRYVEEVPISVTTSVLPELAVPNMESYLGEFHSLYAIVETHYHYRPVRMWTIFQATWAGAKDADHLKMPIEVPILRTERLMCHPVGQPVEYAITRMRGDMSRLRVEFASGDLCEGRWETK